MKAIGQLCCNYPSVPSWLNIFYFFLAWRTSLGQFASSVISPCSKQCPSLLQAAPSVLAKGHRNPIGSRRMGPFAASTTKAGAVLASTWSKAPGALASKPEISIGSVMLRHLAAGQCLCGGCWAWHNYRYCHSSAVHSNIFVCITGYLFRVGISNGNYACAFPKLSKPHRFLERFSNF